MYVGKQSGVKTTAVHKRASASRHGWEVSTHSVETHASLCEQLDSRADCGVMLTNLRQCPVSC